VEIENSRNEQANISKEQAVQKEPKIQNKEQTKQEEKTESVSHASELQKEEIKIETKENIIEVQQTELIDIKENLNVNKSKFFLLFLLVLNDF